MRSQEKENSISHGPCSLFFCVDVRVTLALSQLQLSRSMTPWNPLKLSWDEDPLTWKSIKAVFPSRWQDLSL